jgi:two-component system, chemotaxis family, CheB/CheR fusion protein
MLFLDRNLCIKRYTGALRQIFNIKSHDQGWPINDLTHNMGYQDLERDAARVLHELAPVERQIKLRTGESMLVRIRTYRTAEDKIDGVVVTFVKLISSA